MLFEIVLFTVQVITLLLSFPDPPNGEEWQALDDGLAYGTDMVRHIRQEFGDCFTVCVAGEDRIIVFLINNAVCSSRKYQCIPRRRNSVKTPPNLMQEFFVLTGLPTLFPQEISIPVVAGVFLVSGTAQCQCNKFPVWTICVRNH